MQYKLYHKNRSMRQIVRQQMHLPHFDRFIALRVGDRCLMQPVLSSRNLDHRYLEVEFRRVKNEFEFKYFFRSSNIRTSFNTPTADVILYRQLFTDRAAGLLCCIPLSCSTSSHVGMLNEVRILELRIKYSNSNSFLALRNSTPKYRLV